MKSNTNIKEGYKKTAVGVIPEEWEVKKLKEIGSFYRGKGIPKSHVIENGLNAIRYGEIYTIHHYYIKEFQSFISKDTAETSFLINKNDILFTSSGETLEDIGKSVAYLGDEEAYAGGDTIILRPLKNNFDSKFLGFITNSDAFRVQTYKKGQGQSVVHIYPSNLKKTKLPIPPLPEQQAIANCLTTWDKGIETLSTLIAAKREQKKGLMQQLLTGKKRLKGFVGEWEEVKLGDKFEYKNGKSYEKEITDNGKYNLITLNSIDITGELKNTHHKVNINDNSLKKDDVIMILSDVAHGYFLGLSALIPDNSYVLNQRVGGLRLKSNDNVFFIRMLINFNQRYFKRMGQGSSQQNLSKGDILKFKFKLPSLEEQNAITTILTTADKEIALLEKKLEAMKEEKKGLMQGLLTGEKRLKVEN